MCVYFMIRRCCKNRFTHLLDVKEAGRLQHLTQRLHQFGFVYRIHSLIDDLKETVTGLLTQLLHRHVTEQHVHKPTQTHDHINT